MGKLLTTHWWEGREGEASAASHFFLRASLHLQQFQIIGMLYYLNRYYNGIICSLATGANHWTIVSDLLKVNTCLKIPEKE